MTAVSFFVVGTPAPQGSKSFKGMRNGHAVMVESSKAVKPWRDAIVRTLALRPGRTVTVRGPVEVTLDFALARPQRPKFPVPGVKPDIDKLVRSTLDALVEARAIEDDARVVRLRAWKRYALPGEATGVGVTIRPAVVAELRGPMGATA